MKVLNRSQITLFAKQEFLDWVKSVKPELYRWDLKTINHRPTAYLIDEEDQNCHGLVLENAYREIIANELENLYIEKELWPEGISYNLFLKWFSYQYHEEIYDLSSESLELFDD